jgi:esterase/lipase superfamily enzyme
MLKDVLTEFARFDHLESGAVAQKWWGHRALESVRNVIASYFETRSEPSFFAGIESLKFSIAQTPTPRSLSIRDIRFKSKSIQSARHIDGRAAAQPEFVVRYLRPRDAQVVFVGIFVSESRQRRWGAREAQTNARNLLTALWPQYLFPQGFARRENQEDHHWRKFALSRLHAAYKDRAILVKAFDPKELSETELADDLLLAVLFMQRIAYAELVASRPQPGLAFHKETSAFRIVELADRFTPPSSRKLNVFFGTNRQLNPSIAPGTTSTHNPFLSKRGSALSLGWCRVNIPKSHRFGSTGSSWWKRLTSGHDDRIKLEGTKLCNSMTEFETQVRYQIDSSPTALRQVLLYIHGYNVSFSQAAVRAAQLGADLRVPTTAFFSWPSRATLKGYSADEATIEASEPFLIEFLMTLARAAGGEPIHVLAHSMGNRALLRAIDRMLKQGIGGGVQFGQLLLAAPDVDAAVFTELATACTSVSTRTTLYVCEKDKALEASGWLHNYPRAGFCPPRTIIAGLDTVEASNVNLTTLGHGYYGEAEAVLHDIHSLIYHNQAPQHRLRLEERVDPSSGSVYWEIGA